MQSYHYFLSLDTEVVKQLLPLGDSLVGAVVTLATALFTYMIGRKKSVQEVANLQAEKKSIEAASGVSTAEAAKIISDAAAATVQPLVERVREQAEEIRILTARNIELRDLNEALKTHAAGVEAENVLMRKKFIIQGSVPPELPPEVK